MNPSNLQYQSSDRGSDIVFLRRLLIKFLVLILVASFALFSLFQASPSFSQSQTIVINEFVPHPSSGSDWIELFNLSGADVDISGWSVFDSTGKVKTFGAGTIVEGDDPDGNNFYHFTVGNRLNNSGDEIKLYSPSSAEEPVNSKNYAEDLGLDNSLVRYPDGGEAWFVSTQPTPNAKNIYQAPENLTSGDEEEAEEQQEEKQQPQPAISFSSPSAVSVGTAFSVTVNLSNFKPGTYFLKVLIGKGDKFYDGRTKGTNGKWLAWNAGWADFPKVTAGSGSGTVQAKTDDDVVAGSCLIKVRAYDGKDTFDSDTKSLTVTGSAKPGGTSRASGGEELGSDSAEEILGEVTGGDGEVKGEDAPRQDGGFKLNFYIILGIFGMLVGSGGLILSVARKRSEEQGSRAE